MSPVSEKPRKPRKKKPVAKAPLKLNLACGQNPIRDANGDVDKSWTGVDLHPGEYVDIVHDLLTFPWPFEDSSVSHAFCSHFVEHIPHEIGTNGYFEDWVDGFFQFFEELHRVMEPGGEVRIIHPYCFSSRAFQDPTHRRFIPVESWYYLDRNWTKANGLDHYCCPTADYEAQIIGHYMGQWGQRSEDARVQAQTQYINVIADLEVLLKVRK